MRGCEGTRGSVLQKCPGIACTLGGECVYAGFQSTLFSLSAAWLLKF
jgi:hypothetical protein